MFLYYDVINGKKIISVISKTKLDYLGDNYIKKDKVPESGILYLDDKDNLIVEEVKEEDLEAKAEDLKKKVDSLEGELKEVKKEAEELKRDDLTERLTNIEVALSEMMGGGE